MFLQELTALATQTSLLVVLLIVGGVIFCFIEAIVPGFGFFGITGILSVMAGIVIHAVYTGSAIQVFILLLIIFLVFTLIVLIFLRSAKYGLLAKLSFVETKTALPLKYDEIPIEDLVGKIGVTVTECRPIGKIQIGEGIYDASARTEYLIENEKVLVTEVEGNSIYIEKLYDKGEK